MIRKYPGEKACQAGNYFFQDLLRGNKRVLFNNRNVHYFYHKIDKGFRTVKIKLSITRVNACKLGINFYSFNYNDIGNRLISEAFTDGV